VRRTVVRPDGARRAPLGWVHSVSGTEHRPLDRPLEAALPNREDSVATRANAQLPAFRAMGRLAAVRQDRRGVAEWGKRDRVSVEAGIDRDDQ